MQHPCLCGDQLKLRVTCGPLFGQFKAQINVLLCIIIYYTSLITAAMSRFCIISLPKNCVLIVSK